MGRDKLHELPTLIPKTTSGLCPRRSKQCDSQRLPLQYWQNMSNGKEGFQIRSATRDDIPVILQLIRDLATYERAPNDVVATEDDLMKSLFDQAAPAAEVRLAFETLSRSASRCSSIIFRPG